jgi:ABC-type oligopeptide transport system ATPase subunit
MKKLLTVKNLTKYFPIKRGIFRRHAGDVKAVDGVSFSIHEGEVVGLVGESGSGKSTVGRTAIRLIEPTNGEIEFLGKNFRAVPQKELRSLRSKLQMVFQDPLASLNPRKTVLDNIGEPLLFHKMISSRDEQVQEVKRILSKIGIPSSALDQYPHQFSGGQQQRLSIGRAIGLNPKLVICDEAVSALDLSVQAQILNLLQDLKQDYGLSYLFISHDLSVVRHFCDRILVMYKGKIVEEGLTEAIFDDPKHPYTQLLLASIPKKHPREK